MNRLGRNVLVFLPLALLLAVVGFAIFLLVSFGYVDFLMNGPKTVLSVRSPDGQYEAYVEDWPSIDGPNQSLFVEREDKLHFLRIAKLPEDVDSIKEILWSPDSQMVVFHSWDHLTVTRVTDWSTARVYLGHEWRRRLPKRHRTTFTSGAESRRVDSIEFPEPGVVAYRLKEDRTLHTVHMDLLLEPH